jgi:hypothetical protein
MSSETMIHLPSKKKVRFTLENKKASSGNTRWASLKVQFDDAEHTSHEFCIFFRTLVEQNEFNQALADAATEFLSAPTLVCDPQQPIPHIDSTDGE